LNTDPPQTDASRNPAQNLLPDWTAVTDGVMSGDAHSLEVFYEHFFDLMLRQARRVTGSDEQTCLDIVQDSMLKIIRCMKRIDDEDCLTAWTRAVVNSVAYDWLRKKSRLANRHSEQLGQVVDTHTDSDFETKLIWLEEQVERMDPQLRQLIAWRYRFGWTLAKIASRCGLETGAVDGRIRRAVKKLRKRAEVEFDD
jgi:RNA polymerase sigma-70 factor (ECF subfamily)